jgi:acetyltransferase
VNPPRRSSLDGIFRPRSIAVVGASRRRDAIGRVLLENLLRGGFEGPVYPVNPRAEYVQSIRCHKSLREIPGPVDLAVVVVPKEEVRAVMEDCARKKVKGVVLITAGFRETGAGGAASEREILALARRHGIRMVGPNCMGIINTEAEHRVNATFAASRPTPGHVGFMTQSGALGEAILGFAEELRLGISMFASMGNKADVSGNDLLEYWENDERTRVILMYLESFGNPRKFTAIAKRLSRKKPLVAVKAGSTLQGARAVASHTGALAGMDFAADALFGQCGVVRVASIEEMFDLALCLVHQPLPKGRRVAILTNAGGPGVLATDAVVSLGLELAPLSERTKRRLRRVLPPEASVQNPVDMIASANPFRYRRCLEALLTDPGIDSLLAIFTPPIMINAVEVARAIVEVTKGRPKTVLACFMGVAQGAEAVRILRAGGVPVYSFPESAARVLALVERYRRWKARPAHRAPRFQAGPAAAPVLASARRRGAPQLDFQEARALFESYGVAFPPCRMASSADEAMEVAEQIGFPVVLKVAAGAMAHRTERGGVVVNLRDVAAVREAFRAMQARFGKKCPLLVQKMIEGGKEVIIGMSQVAGFGPVMMFGLGGIHVEFLKDVSFRLPPLNRDDAREMIRGVRAFPMLEGVRGEKAVDTAALERCLLRLSRMAEDHGDAIEAFDLNPVIVTPKGAWAADAKVFLKKGRERGNLN